MNSVPAVICRDLTVTFPDKFSPISQLDFALKQGEWLGICGRNGSGKTSLLYALAGIIPKFRPAKITGQIRVNLKQGIVFQNPDFSLFNLTVEEEAQFGHHQSVAPALKAVGLWRFRRSDPQTLSYGQKQKLCLASVLAKNPELLLLDEPTSMLDYTSTQELYRLLTRLHRLGKTIITVEHDTGLINQYADRVLILDRGRAVAQGPVKKVLKQKKTLSRLGLRPL